MSGSSVSGTKTETGRFRELTTISSPLLKDTEKKKVVLITFNPAGRKKKERKEDRKEASTYTIKKKSCFYPIDEFF